MKGIESSRCSRRRAAGKVPRAAGKPVVGIQGHPAPVMAASCMGCSRGNSVPSTQPTNRFVKCGSGLGSCFPGVTCGRRRTPRWCSSARPVQMPHGHACPAGRRDCRDRRPRSSCALLHADSLPVTGHVRERAARASAIFDFLGGRRREVQGDEALLAVLVWLLAPRSAACQPGSYQWKVEA